MGKFRLDAVKTVEYTVFVDAESIADAELIIQDWVDEDFEPFKVWTSWKDDEEWEEVIEIMEEN